MITGWILRFLAIALLTAWAAGLSVSALRLSAWEGELVQTLLQIRADRTFRVRMAERREPIPREWYRSKALALLAAGDKLQDDSAWTVFLPGSWHRVDDLRERLALRIEREFSEIAVDTVRRELDFRASQLAGVPRDNASGALLGGRGCADPVLAQAGPAAAHSAEPPELQAVQSHLSAIEELDQAVQALVALQTAGNVNPEPLRLLVRYTLGAEPPRLARSALLFRQVLQPADPTQHAARMAQLQQAVRCSVAKRMAALDARLFERNDLLTSEAALAVRTAELLRPAAPARPQVAALERWREVVTLISRQEALLAQDDNAWMKGAGHSLGPAHDALLARIARIDLLGPEATQQVRRQSVAALQRLRQRLAGTLGSGKEPALLWLEDQGRLALSPQRLALRDELAALLQQPFMAPAGEQALPDAATGPLAWDLQRLEQLFALRQVRKRFVAESLHRFPASVRPAVARFVELHLARQVEAGLVEAMSVARDGAAALDPAAWRAQRQQAGKVQALLAELGARPRAEKLRALLVGDVVQRLALAERALAESAFASARLQDFGWWQGDGAPVLVALGVADALTLRYVLAQQVTGVELAGRQAAVVLDVAREGSVAHPVVARWQGIVGDLERYRTGRADSSLRALERLLLTLGAELQVANCLERLAAAPPPRPQGDEFAQRHRQIHEALARRCGELRAAPRPQEPAAIPFG